MRRVPWLLVLSRFALAPVVVALALGGERGAIVACMLFALVGDVVDGKLARRLGVATSRLRKADSLADLAFWLAALAAAWVLEASALAPHAVWIALLVALEAAIHASSRLRFAQAPANHAWSAKLWGIVLCASLVAIVGWGRLGLLFGLAIGVGLAAQVEGLAIVWLLPGWRRDVPSCFHALAIRRGAAREAGDAS